MARTSKVALATAATLAVAIILAGTALAAADEAPTVHAEPAAAAPPPSLASANGRDSLSAVGGRHAEHWRQDAARRGQMPAVMDGERSGGGSWAIGEILQWIAIGLLGGGAVGLAVWRPWRPIRAAAGPSGAAAAASTTSPGPGEPTAAASAPQAPGMNVAVSSTPSGDQSLPAGECAGPTQTNVPRPRHWRRRERS